MHIDEVMILLRGVYDDLVSRETSQAANLANSLFYTLSVLGVSYEAWLEQLDAASAAEDDSSDVSESGLAKRTS